MNLWIFLRDWADFALRWLHVVAAIFWVGAALIFLRLNLVLKSSKRDVWRAADDGFFHIARAMAAPGDAQVGWFRWEAYATWLSGLALLILRYFLQADLYLIDPAVLPLAPWQAVLLALAGLVVGWLGYDLLARARWPEPVRRAVVFAFLVALVFFYSRVFSGRGAWIEFGAILGTIMAANVAHWLVPNQRRMLEATGKGEQPDEARLAASRQRALHNNYLALPVLFLMLSTHYPLAFAGRFAWAVAALALVVGAAVRHFYIARHRGEGDLWWTWALAAAGALCMALLTFAGTAAPERAAAAPRNAMEALDAAVAPRFADVQDIVSARCVMCHADAPAWPGLVAAPAAVRLDAPRLVRAHAADIAAVAVLTNAMPPPGAGVGMTPGERQKIGAWLAAGAPDH